MRGLVGQRQLCHGEFLGDIDVVAHDLIVFFGCFHTATVEGQQGRLSIRVDRKVGVVEAHKPPALFDHLEAQGFACHHGRSSSTHNQRRRTGAQALTACAHHGFQVQAEHFENPKIRLRNKIGRKKYAFTVA